MTKLDWIKKQIDLAGEGHENFLGDLREKFLTQIEEAGESLTRTKFWKLFEELSPEDDSLFCDYMLFDTQLCYAADFSEAWDVTKAPILPEIRVEGGFRFDSVKLPGDFIKLGGEPDWIQDERYPICEKCDRDMGLLFQVKSLPYEITKKRPELERYSFGDAGNMYVFQCPECGGLRSDEQCH